jgi:hypothetical protein
MSLDNGQRIHCRSCNISSARPWRKQPKISSSEETQSSHGQTQFGLPQNRLDLLNGQRDLPDS